MQEPKINYTNESLREIKRLKIKTRNKIRALVSASDDELIRTVNNLRASVPAKELIRVDRVIKSLSKHEKIIPECFPDKPQTKESFFRLSPLSFDRQLEVIDLRIHEYNDRLKSFFLEVKNLNQLIIDGYFKKSDEVISLIFGNFGYSHFILRKVALIRFLEGSNSLPSVENFLDSSGIGKNNVIVSSLIHCFQEEQDLISMKRAVMGIHDKGDKNKFTRDITRIAFHPHAKDSKDLIGFLQSVLQSSLIDAIICIKVNKHLVDLNRYKNIKNIICFIDESSSHIDSIARMYLEKDDSEELFYKHSCAWLEADSIVEYRAFQDHFYDSPESSYFEITNELISRVGGWVSNIELGKLSDPKAILTTHGYSSLRDLEGIGTITRSSVFNFKLNIKEGCDYIGEQELIDLMGVTSSLARTINIAHAKTLAMHIDSDLSKIIVYLLVAKRGRNEKDSHNLRRVLQRLIKSEHKGKVALFVSHIAIKSPAIAKFIYEVATEDFIAMLSHIVKSPNDITETRASLHRWMGEFTGEKLYLDRARNILIDQQINLVRDEIDDNRIYVDINRFLDWIEDEISQELSTLLIMLEHNNALEEDDNPQLRALVEKCYSEFYSNNFFGIASYLGRRIRHGTFKGNLYSSVISIQDRFNLILRETAVLSKWEKWKEEYEKKIMTIIHEKLHIESPKKREGLLQPNLKAAPKNDIAVACIKSLLNDYSENKHIYGSPQILVEYCWRLAEVDLRSVNSFLKSQRVHLVNSDLISEIKASASQEGQDAVKDFARDLQSLVNEKLTATYGWFKRPQSVAPKASLALLYKAVVAEVRQSYLDFNPSTDFDENEDIVLMGGAYHVIYDALYVVVYNAAKHGKSGGCVFREFLVGERGNAPAIQITISSQISDHESEDEINERLSVSPLDDIENAQMDEGRSGIKKLYHLQKSDKQFNISNILCANRQVTISFSYAMVH